MRNTFYIIPLGISAILSSSVFLYASFLFLAPPRGDTLVTKMRPHEATQTAPAPAASSLAFAQPLPNNVPREATQPALTPANAPDYLASISRFFAVYSQRAQEAVYSQRAQEKGMSYEQYRARLQYLHKQQTEIELRLADPNLSTGERLRLERQNAYWGRAIREMLGLP